MILLHASSGEFGSAQPTFSNIETPNIRDYHNTPKIESSISLHTVLITSTPTFFFLTPIVVTIIGIILHIGGSRGDEAFGNEFVLFLAGGRGQILFHQLSTTDSLTSTRFEFTHVFTVSLSLVLFGIHSASLERRIDGDTSGTTTSSRERTCQRKGLYTGVQGGKLAKANFLVRHNTGNTVMGMCSCCCYYFYEQHSPAVLPISFSSNFTEKRK